MGRGGRALPPPSMLLPPPASPEASSESPKQLSPLSPARKIWAAQYKYLRRAEEESEDGLVVDLLPLSCDNVSKNIARARSQHAQANAVRSEPFGAQVDPLASPPTPTLTASPMTGDDEEEEQTTFDVAVVPMMAEGDTSESEDGSSIEAAIEALMPVSAALPRSDEAEEPADVRPARSPSRVPRPPTPSVVTEGGDSIAPAAIFVAAATVPPVTVAVTAIVAIVASFVAIYTCTSLWQSPSPPPPPPSAPDLPTLLERSTALALGGASLVIAFVGAGARCSSGMWGAGYATRDGIAAGGQVHGRGEEEEFVVWRREAAGPLPTSPARLKRIGVF